MAVAMLVMSLGLGLPQFASSSGTIALVGTLTYVVCFALGAGPVPGILVPEINPPKLRGVRSVTLASCASTRCLPAGARRGCLCVHDTALPLLKPGPG